MLTFPIIAWCVLLNINAFIARVNICWIKKKKNGKSLPPPESSKKKMFIEKKKFNIERGRKKNKNPSANNSTRAQIACTVMCGFLIVPLRSIRQSACVRGRQRVGSVYVYFKQIKVYRILKLLAIILYYTYIWNRLSAQPAHRSRSHNRKILDNNLKVNTFSTLSFQLTIHIHSHSNGFYVNIITSSFE